MGITSQVKHCSKICLQYKAKKTKKAQSFYEIEGVKYCQHCETFIKWDGIRCPCCKWRLRQRPRSNDAIDKYRKLKKVKYQ